MGSGCVTAIVGQTGNFESESTDFNVKPAVGYRGTLKKLEVNFTDEWTNFDKDLESYTVYYGWLRGNVRGQYKLKIRQNIPNNTIDVEFIMLNRHGVGGMGISEFKDMGNQEKEDTHQYDWLELPANIKISENSKITSFVNSKDTAAFISKSSIRVPLKGRDNWGPFTTVVKAEVFNKGEIMIGSWHCDHGIYGDYRGTLYGVRLDQATKALGSSHNDVLYNILINFNPNKK